MVGGVLVALELIYLFIVPRQKVLTVKEALDKAVSQQNVDPKRREQLRIQLALNDFKAKNEGKLPAKLDELVPTYFDEVPKDPDNGEAFRYVVKDNKPYVGDAATVAVAENKVAVTATDGSIVIPATLESSSQLPSGIQQALISSLSVDSGSQNAFIYDPTGKRDPFRPFDFSPHQAEDETKTPLERYDINQLKLTAVLTSEEDPSATVENAAGKGFIVKKGTKIGFNSGEVVEILKDRVLILETSIDFTGQKKTRTIEMKLRTKDQENSQKIKQ